MLYGHKQSEVLEHHIYLLTQKVNVFSLILQQSNLLIRESTTIMIPGMPNNIVFESHFFRVVNTFIVIIRK